MTLGLVLIGRNEGERFLRCLESIRTEVGLGPHVVYVDSGSTDGSVEAARAAGVRVVELDLSRPFTAARARNAGLAVLREGLRPEFVQFVDGDCEIRQGWLAAGLAFLDAHPRAAVVAGRNRERFPEASRYNRLCDREWDTALGEVMACGGIAMMRMAALDQSGDFNPALIAGEEPELCVRLRAAGWQVWRIADEMTWHDAAMTRFGQWWRRTRRGGHAAAEGAEMHGRGPERLGVDQVRRALLWGGLLPVSAVAGTVFTPWSLALLAAWPLQVLRLARRFARETADPARAWEAAFFLTLGKIPEALGVADYHLHRVLGRRARIIEYK